MTINYNLISTVHNYATPEYFFLFLQLLILDLMYGKQVILLFSTALAFNNRTDIIYGLIPLLE